MMEEVGIETKKIEKEKFGKLVVSYNLHYCVMDDYATFIPMGVDIKEITCDGKNAVLSKGKREYLEKKIFAKSMADGIFPQREMPFEEEIVLIEKISSYKNQSMLYEEQLINML